ncbi:MAG: efflux RND transporter periplasmic adaptor subunit [Patescibacteria group bacterium]|jgi:HlyD family secretion protein
MKIILTKTRVIVGVVIIAAVGGGLYLRFGRSTAPSYETAPATRGDIVQTVDVTGHVEASTDVKLAFERGGRIAAVLVKVGDHVTKDQALVQLDAATFTASIAEAKASVASAIARLAQYQAAVETARAELAELKSGATPEELQLAETKVARAEQALSDAQRALENAKATATTDLASEYGDAVDVLHEAYRQADDAVNKQVDDFFNNDTSGNPQLSFTTADTQAKIDSEHGRITSGEAVVTLQTIVVVDASNQPAVNDALAKTLTQLVNIRAFLTRLNDTLNVSTTLSQTNLTAYRTSLNTARTNVNAAISSITSEQQAIVAQEAKNTTAISNATTAVNDAEQGVTVANNELTITKAGSSADQLAAKEASVRQVEANLSSQMAEVDRAKANLASAAAEYGKTVLRSPINGIVTSKDVTVGEIVAANTSAIALISEANFEIKSYIPEADIAKVHVGDTATVTLDAYGDETVFDATISTIDPAETIIEGVATYRVVLQFVKADERIRSGMTANVTIHSGEHHDVVIIPQRAVFTENGQRVVRVLRNNEPVTVAVETGLRGSTGTIEITKGIEAGEQVIIGDLSK